MKLKQQNIKKVIYFSQWSRKSYAILASLGKIVHIGNVISKIADLALIKLEKSISILNDPSFSIINEISEPDDNDISNKNIKVQLKPITVKYKYENKFRY